MPLSSSIPMSMMTTPGCRCLATATTVLCAPKLLTSKKPISLLDAEAAHGTNADIKAWAQKTAVALVL